MKSFSATILLLFSLALLSLVHSKEMKREFSRTLHHDHQHSGQQSSERRSKRHHWMAFPHHRDQHRHKHHGKPGKHYNKMDMELYLRSSKKHNTHHERHPGAMEYFKIAEKIGSKQIKEALHGTDSDSESSSRSSSTSSSSSSSSESSTSSDDESSRGPKIEVDVLEVEEVARVEQEVDARDESN
jgi:hypothetical protein